MQTGLRCLLEAHCSVYAEVSIASRCLCKNIDLILISDPRTWLPLCWITLIIFHNFSRDATCVVNYIMFATLVECIPNWYAAYAISRGQMNVALLFPHSKWQSASKFVQPCVCVFFLFFFFSTLPVIKLIS